jgi:hypothetical protein
MDPYSLRSKPHDLPSTLQGKCAKYKPGRGIARTMQTSAYPRPMTSKKDPPTPSATPPKTPETEPAKQPIEVVTEVIANAIGHLRGLQGPDVAKAVSGVQREVQNLVSSVEEKANDPATRKAAAQEVERLIELFTKTGAALGGALAAYKEPVVKAMQGVDMQKAADTLRMLADWMKNPTAEREAEVKKAVGELEATMGPMVGHDPAREEQKRRDEIKADVKASLDEIFRGKKKPTT